MNGFAVLTPMFACQLKLKELLAGVAEGSSTATPLPAK
jgi:hypothetical protein